MSPSAIASVPLGNGAASPSFSGLLASTLPGSPGVLEAGRSQPKALSESCQTSYNELVNSEERFVSRMDFIISGLENGHTIKTNIADGKKTLDARIDKIKTFLYECHSQLSEPQRAKVDEMIGTVEGKKAELEKAAAPHGLPRATRAAFDALQRVFSDVRDFLFQDPIPTVPRPGHVPPARAPMIPRGAPI